MKDAPFDVHADINLFGAKACKVEGIIGSTRKIQVPSYLSDIGAGQDLVG